MFTYVTGNPNKIASAKEKLGKAGIEFVHKKIDLVEIQATDGEEIAFHKARAAFELLNTPVVVQDSSWSIPALNGFPGPFMHYISEWLGNEGILKLLNMDSKTDSQNRRMFLYAFLVYKDKNQEKLFHTSKEGTILEKPSGKGRMELDRIISFRKDRLSYADCIDKNLEPYDKPSSVWDQFIAWYKKANS